MKIGAVYPQTEMETDPGAVTHYAQAVEEMGFDHILIYDHVIGAGPDTRPGANLPYTINDPFHEPFVLMTYLAARTSKIGLMTGVLVITQRQAVLAAKQAACVDVLSQGRLRLAVGTGWNTAEYQALGMDFSTRGRRVEEQIEVMRRLWTQRSVTFLGEQHTLNDVGLLPMPVQQPIPLWIGGGNDRAKFGQPANLNVLRRVARIGDGWLQQVTNPTRAAELIEAFRGFCREYGRDPDEVGIESMFNLTAAGQGSWAADMKVWAGLGVSHMALVTLGDGLKGVDAHLKRLEAFRQAVPA